MAWAWPTLRGGTFIGHLSTNSRPPARTGADLVEDGWMDAEAATCGRVEHRDEQPVAGLAG